MVFIFLGMSDLRMIMFLLQVLNINWFQKHQDGNDEVGGYHL